ncbi:MAG: sulfatase-like hydrolase/transferase [Verrucomicrobia bacterium]|nr:sulfatase-like hydrolase/transferase [Verrucomicrobiota bacterium]
MLIISDDQGFADYSFMGHDRIKTPHLDKMAAESLLYTRGYVMPVCSPSLACLLTGKLPSEHGITGNDLSGKRSQPGHREALAEQLLGNSLTLPKAVTEAGYLTFQTGKIWNVTYKDVGFTHGMTGTAGRHGDAGLEIGRKGMKPIYDFIETAKAEDKPFFIWHAPFLPHTPHNPPKEIFEKYKGKGPTKAAEKYYAMCEWFDNTCAELDEYLEKNGLKENTVILYLADNGWDAEYAHAHDRSKLSPYELGIRTPMFVRWPGKVKPQRDDETLAHILDFPKTILDITGAENPGDLKGLNLMDQKALKARDTVFVEAYTHDIADLKDPSKSLIADVVIEGWWKLIVPGPVKPDRKFSGVPATTVLYDLKNDPLEKNDLAAKNPEIVAKLKAKLKK